MKIQLLPSSFDEYGRASLDQRLTCFVIDDCVAIDAGSLALASSNTQRRSVRDIIVTHPHMDHIASLPIFIDDLFESLDTPLRIYATADVIELLERDVFNWTVYPRFTELQNARCGVMEYVPLVPGQTLRIAHLDVLPIKVDHIVPTIGLVVSDRKSTFAFSSDTGATVDLWRVLNGEPRIDVLFIEASFPDSLSQLAEASKHLTPMVLGNELKKLGPSHRNTEILVVHIKPSYRPAVIAELRALDVPHLSIMEPGRTYEW